MSVQRLKFAPDTWAIWSVGPGGAVILVASAYSTVVSDEGWHPAGFKDPELVVLDERLGAR